jgi:DNA-binding SARP family transcriptional activator/ATP/maltotriose-dependent transcriptional regulator MalT
MLNISLFGKLEVTRDGTPVEISSQPAQLLLSYLVLNAGTLHRRDRLAGLLWPDSDEIHARNNLRQALWRLRKAIGQEYILINRTSLGWNPDAEYQSDVATLEERGVEDPSADALIRSVSVYDDILLPGYYDDWVVLEQERWQAVFEQRMQKLLDRLCDEARWREVLEWAERWIAHGDVPEPAYRALMLAHAALGDRASAAADFQRCKGVLAEELAVEPSEETIALYQRIRDGEVAPATMARRRPLDLKPKPPAFLDPDVQVAAGPPEPFVGREAELGRLAGFLENALAGRGQVAFVSGEAGWGKTRLLAEFAHRAQERQPDLIVVSGVCTAFTETGDPYLPFREILRMLCADVEQGWAAGHVTRDHALRLWHLLPWVVEALVRQGRHLIDILVPAEALLQRAAAHESIDPNLLGELQTVMGRRRARPQQTGVDQERIFEEVAHLLQTMSSTQPLLLILDDLHWADVSSLSLLFHLGRHLPDSKLLLLGAYRPEDLSLHRDGQEHPLASILAEFKRSYGDVWLALGDKEGTGRRFVDALLDREPNRLGEGFRARLASNTRGHPLFTVEMLRELEDHGMVYQDETGHWVDSPAITWGALPGRVEGVIERRINRLDPRLQQALAAASVEGEDFTAEVVAQVRGVRESEMVGLLSGDLAKRHYLVRATGIQRLGQRRISSYRFSHNLFQKYLYDTLDPVERVYLHEAVGKALENLYQGHTGEIAVRLASHFQEAGRLRKAVDYWAQAGDAASLVYANTEAIAHYSQAIDLARRIEGDVGDLTLLYMSLGRVLELDSQFDRVLGTYQAMEKLALQRGDRPMELASLLARATVHAVPTAIHNPDRARELGQRALDLAGELGDQAAEAKILWSLSLANYFANRLSEAINCGERSLALARELDLVEQIAQTLNDLGGMIYLYSGHIDQAQKLLREASDRWRALGNVPMLADSLSGSCIASAYAGEYERAIALSEEALRTSRFIENLWGQSYARWTIGDVFRERGEYSRAIEASEKCIRQGELAGFLAAQTYTRTKLALIYGDLGLLERGIQLAEIVLNLAETRDLRVHSILALGVLAHLYVLKGDLAQAEAFIDQGNKDVSRETWAVFYLAVLSADAELALGQGDFERAVTVTEDLLVRLRRYGMRSGLPEALYLQGRALSGLGQIGAARDRLREARAEAEQMGSRRLLWPILSALGELEEDGTQARRLRQSAREIVGTIAGQIDQSELRASFLKQPKVRAVLEAVNIIESPNGEREP